MKIAIIKPDYRLIGGFEIVVDRIIEGLQNLNHEVDYLKVDMIAQREDIGSIKISSEMYNQNPEFFRYVLSINEFRRLDLSAYDIVLCTQPPSFAVNHPKVVVLFYHHLKIYYDLKDVFIQCGLVNEELHEKTTEIVREIDKYYLTDDKHYLAGSEHVANRLRDFNGINRNLSVFAAGINEEYYNYSGEISYNDPICVGRHEFPKRPELFIHAMKHVDGINGRVIGTGGKTEDLKLIDKYLTYIHNNQHEIEDEVLWKKLMFNLKNVKKDIRKFEKLTSNITFTGRTSDEQLIEEYASSMCVVCPSFEEDYGLTAIEAMAFHKPVIACKDGGGYKEFIEDGVNGFVVEPTGEAIAKAINYFKNNPDKLKIMGENAYEFSRKYSWDNSIKDLNSKLVEILNS